MIDSGQDKKKQSELEFVLKLQRQFNAFGQTRAPLNETIEEDRIVVAGPQIFRVPRSHSFHQFLITYGLNKLGSTASAEPVHPLIKTLHSGLVKCREIGATDGGLFQATMNGELYSFLSFSYDMFSLADNAQIQDSLLNRILHPEQFQGARYEVFVAASLLRAGFEINFEDENDLSSSHCEFTATTRNTGKKFSVEAKSRHRPAQTEAKPEAAKMYRLLQNALSKAANHERIIFADVNLPADSQPAFEQSWHHEIAATLTELESRQRPDAPWPQAIIFFTNRMTSPWPGEEDGKSTVLITAINHPLFKVNDRGPVERQYPELGKLHHAVWELCVPPSHFFGQ